MRRIVKPEIRVVEEEAAFYRAAADLFVEAARAAVAARGRFTVALSGGSTPKGIYSLLANDAKWREAVEWGKVLFFWGDERHVAPDHPDSNYRMAHEALLSKLAIDYEGQVFRVKGEIADAGAAAAEYEAVMRRHLPPSTSAGSEGWPEFDLVLLGMGPEGHTLSLFPGTKALSESSRWVTSNWVGKLYTDRITATAPVANNAGKVVFLVRGADKQPALKAVLEGPHEPDQLPAQLIQPVKAPLLWLLDRDAAGMLSHGLTTMP